MTEQTWMQKTGATPAKLALTGVLAVILAVVIWSQGSSPDSTSVATSSRSSAHQTSTEKTQPRTKAPKVADQQSPVTSSGPRWQELPLEAITAHDPLRVPPWYRQNDQEEGEAKSGTLLDAQELVEKLQQETSRIVIVTGDEKVAQFGEVEIRVGDMIQGFRVTEITTDGIVFSELKSR